MTIGRPRDTGERYPSGKLKAPARFAGMPPAQIRRALDLVMTKAADPRMGSAVGCLLIEGKLTAPQAAAAMSYAELRGRFHRLMGFRARTAASPSYEQGYGQASGPEDELRIVRARLDHTAMLKVYDSGGQIDLDALCIDDKRPASYELPRITALLDRLVVHFGLTG